MSVLGVVDPEECDEQGVPLDWERCRTCSDPAHPRIDLGVGADWVRPCPVCDSHGSLKAAALAELHRAKYAGAGHIDPSHGTCGCISCAGSTVRCDGCGHPMSDGTWDGDGRLQPTLHALRLGVEPKTGGVHWSSCEEGCRHQGDVRARNTQPDDGSWGWTPAPMPPIEAGLTAGEVTSRVAALGPRVVVEASWRAVDVRTLGWPHDLRPERLAVLCLRCWAERTAG